MKYGRYGWSHLFMSWGLGATFLWIGLNILQDPNAWIGYVPSDLPFSLSREQGLRIGGALDIIIGIALILRLWPKTIAALASIHLALILVKNGLDPVLIRDVGLLGMALALLTWPTHYRKHKKWMFWQKKKKGGGEGDSGE